MSIALQQFPDQLACTLLKMDGVGIGPLLPEDVGALFTWTNDVETNALDLPHRPTDGIAFSGWLNGFATDLTRVLFVIRVAGTAQATGFLMLSNIHGVNRSADLGIRIGREGDRGRGIGTAAVVLGLRYAWDHLNLGRVQLRVLADNARAIRAYERAGFAIEGRHARAVYVGGGWHDSLTMAALSPR
ncbi:MAG TPA: GNAT family protein [Rhizomicrobium sp.]|jgi:RimJ/RimL family protein N-acetyltransferase|nr:GNAT family protein [Rhizomicrobium sp.]